MVEKFAERGDRRRYEGDDAEYPMIAVQAQDAEGLEYLVRSILATFKGAERVSLPIENAASFVIRDERLRKVHVASADKKPARVVHRDTASLH